MRKASRLLIRILMWFIALLFGTFIIASIALYLYFDLNDYKPQIKAYLYDQTNIPLDIEGDIHLTLFPWIGLKVEKIKVDELASIEVLDLKIPLHELLQKNIQIHSISVKNLDLKLIKYQNGNTNWETYLSAKKNTAPLAESKETKETSSLKKSFAITLKYVDLYHAKISYVDHQKKEEWVLSNLDLKGNYSSSKAVPIKTEFEFTRSPLNGITSLKGNTQLNGTLQFSDPKPIIDLKANATIEFPGTALDKTDFQAQLQGDLSKQITLNSFNLQSGSTRAKGNVTLPLSTASPITFTLDINELDLNKFEAFTQKSPPTAPVKKQTSEMKKSSVANNRGEPSMDSLKGQLTIGTLRYDDYQLTHVKTSLHKKNETLTLSPFSAKLYNGNLNVTITQSGEVSSIQGSLTDLPIQSVLKALGKPEKLTGTGVIDFNLSKLPRHDLEGVIKCQISQGIIQGIDISYYLALAQSYIKKTENTTSDSKQTPFDKISATLMLHDNIIDNNDLTIINPNFIAKAEGSVYLEKKTLAYKLQANKTYEDGKAHPNAYPLAIRIKGPIDNPKIEPDYDVYIKKFADLELKKQLEKHVKKNLQKLLGVDDAASNEESSNESGSKIDKEIGKGLKKIFKLP